MTATTHHQEFGEEGIEELTRSLDDTELASLPVWVKGRGWVYPEDLDEDDDGETSATPESRAAQISLRHMDNVLLDEENQPDVAAVAVPRGSAASLEAPSTSEPVRGGAAKKEPSTAAAASVLRNGTTLDAWQLAQLQSALATHGRRGVEVAKLAKRLGLQRNDVLAWLKDHGNAAPRMAGDAEPDAAGAARAAERAAERAKAAAAPEPHDWRASRASFGAGRLKARQVATLDAVFAVHAYPSTAVLRELARRTRLPHWRVALWFTERRGARRASPPPPR